MRVIGILTSGSERARGARTLLGFAAILLIGLADSLTGRNLSLSLFYLFPIAFISWTSRGFWGTFAAVVGTGIWVGAVLATGPGYSHWLLLSWNAAMRLGIFLAVSFLIFELRKTLDHVQALSRIDSLTGAANSRQFQQVLRAEIDRSQRYKRPFTLAFVDLDNFKAVNDTQGHCVGDSVLQSVVGVLRADLRKTDTIARIGGDEFALLLPECALVQAPVVIERARGKLMEAMKSNSWPVTFSIGVVSCQDRHRSPEELIGIADRFMYAAKSNGKNGVRYAGDCTDEAAPPPPPNLGASDPAPEHP